MLVPDTGWTFFHIYCCKNFSVLFEKTENKINTEKSVRDKERLKIHLQLIIFYTKYLPNWSCKEPLIESERFTATLLESVLTLQGIRLAVSSVHFLNGPFIDSFFFNFIFSIQLIVNTWIIIRQWLDSNLGPLVSEATAPPTEPQPLPPSVYYY